MTEVKKETQTNQDDKSKKEDLSEIKPLAAIGYIGILFLVPMLARPKSEYAMFHANQGLLLTLTAVAINIVGWAIPVLGWLLIVPVGNIVVLVLLIMGIVAALNGEMKRLPIIGKWDILKVQD